MLAIRAALTFALALAAAAPVYADPTDDLFMAARGGTASEVRAAVSAGADSGARDEMGRTPLHWAAGMNPAPSVITALIEGGADPDARTEKGLTPLHMAVVNNDPAVIEALIQAGADPNIRDFSSLFTPLGIAEFFGNSAVIEALRKAMAPTTIKATPLRDPPPALPEPRPASLPRSPATASSPYDGSRPPRSVAEIRAYCERELLQIGGWSMVRICVDTETRAFKALHP